MPPIPPPGPPAACLDVGLLAGATDDRGVLLVDRHLLGAATEGLATADLIEAKALLDELRA